MKEERKEKKNKGDLITSSCLNLHEGLSWQPGEEVKVDKNRKHFFFLPVVIAIKARRHLFPPAVCVATARLALNIFL